MFSWILAWLKNLVLRFQFVKLSATHLHFQFIQRKWIGFESIDENVLKISFANSRRICGNSHENLQCAPKDSKFPLVVVFCSTSYISKPSQWHSALRSWIVLDFMWIPVYFFLLLSVCEYIIKIPSRKLQFSDVILNVATHKFATLSRSLAGWFSSVSCWLNLKICVVASAEIGPELYGQQCISECWRNIGCKMHWFCSSWEFILRADRCNENLCCRWILSTEYCPLFPVGTTTMTLPGQTCLILSFSCRQVNSASHHSMSPEQAICELRKVARHCVHKLPSRVCCKTACVWGWNIYGASCKPFSNSAV